MTHVSVGTLVVALAALNYDSEGKRDKVRNAFLLLRCLVSSKSLPSADTPENMATLLHLQGFRRVSGLLCPIVCPVEMSTDSLQQGAPPLEMNHLMGLWHMNCPAQ